MKDFELMENEWPSKLVARSEIARFTGGAFKSGTLANLDSKGEGPSGRFRLGKKIVYPKTELVQWLKGRSAPCETGPKEVADE